MWSKLHIAAMKGDVEEMERILTAEEEVINVRENSICGYTPLGIAISSGQLESIRFLLARGADTAKVNNHVDAIHLAKNFKNQKEGMIQLMYHEMERLISSV